MTKKQTEQTPGAGGRCTAMPSATSRARITPGGAHSAKGHTTGEGSQKKKES